MRPVRAKALNIARSFNAFALTGRQVWEHDNPGRCPGLRASALSGRAACFHCSGLRTFGPSGRAACIHCSGLRAFGPSGRAACILCPGLRASALSGRAACFHCPGLRASGPFRACCLYPLLWAKSFWAFSPYINHLRNLSKQYVRWAPQKAIPPKSHKRTERQGHPPAPEKHPPASEKHPPASEKHPHSILPRRSPPSRNEPGQRAPCGTHDNS